MPPHSTSASGTPSCWKAVDLELLRRVQVYLVCRSQSPAVPQPWLRAWEQFYHFCDPVIRRFAVACGASAADLDDCVQEIWVALLAEQRTFRYEPWRGQFVSWLYTLVRSKTADRLRDRARHPLAKLTAAMEAALCGSEEDAVAAYERHQRRVRVHEVLGVLRAQLCERYYYVLYLHWIEGRPLSKVAATLGLTPEQAWLCHHRAKQKFRHLFTRSLEEVAP
ncbi:MAG: sigma-70 family RNA polymerase sigma factor [Isosphaeraceae bacterium]|nr:sigma-70 family RNA polymerase sigma factor [Isosphaeraceae bacterium]